MASYDDWKEPHWWKITGTPAVSWLSGVVAVKFKGDGTTTSNGSFWIGATQIAADCVYHSGDDSVTFSVGGAPFEVTRSGATGHEGKKKGPGGVKPVDTGASWTAIEGTGGYPGHRPHEGHDPHDRRDDRGRGTPVSPADHRHGGGRPVGV